MQVFDISNQADVVKLLRFVRSSSLDPDDKDQVRDLVLDYMQTKNDDVLGKLSVYLAAADAALADDTAIEAAAATSVEEAVPNAPSDVPTTAVSDPDDATAAPTSADQAAAIELAHDIRFSPKNVGFGNARPEPTFSASAQEVAEAAQPVTPAAAGIDTAAETPAQPVAEQRADTEPGAAAAQPAPTAADVAAIVSHTPPSVEQFAERIKEIKHLVNEKVGNPVHLIDANNTVGREYMNALLQAMKMTSLESATDAKLAMDRLEKAYQAVAQFLAEHGGELPREKKPDPSSVTRQQTATRTSAVASESQTSSAAPAHSPEPKIEPTSPTIPQSNKAAATPSAQPSQREPDVPAATSQQTIPSTETKAPTAALSTDVNAPMPAAAEIAPSIGAVYQQQKKQSVPISAAKPAEDARAETAAVSDVTPATNSSQPVPAPAVVAQKSVQDSIPASAPTPETARTVPVKTESATPSGKPAKPATAPSRPPTHAAVSPFTAASDRSAPLQTTDLQSQLKQTLEEEQQELDAELNKPEVTAGLDQLLSEWSLFKSSGLFGTGPSGREHPLYKKLQGLSMATIIAGRFEGVTPVIKQSITDYMNGWRYEQGITHSHTETFEHYLRRVIRKILDDHRSAP